MKRLSMLMMCLFAMMAASLSAKAQEITINLRPGWNWIGYPNAMSMEINDAFGDFMPMEGDVVKSEFAFAEYNNGIWIGSLTQFMPGRGYMYCSRRTEETSFVFRGSTSQSQVFVTTAEPTTITATSAISGGSVTSNEGSFVLMKGICWATHPNPIANDDYHTENGSGAGIFTVSMTGLTSNTTYYVRAYAVSLSGLTYGEQFVFTTTQTQNYIIDVVANPGNGGTVSGGGTYQQGQSCLVTATENAGFLFAGWTENGDLVSTDTIYTFIVNGNRQLVANFEVVSTYPVGALNGLFSVSETQQVYFSQGNLQYNGDWKFADNQWDYFGDNGQGLMAPQVNRDLFGWGTSGYHDPSDQYNYHYLPWDNSTSCPENQFNAFGYGPSMYPEFSGSARNYDWGIYNCISNGGNNADLWRTLTKNEWWYLFNVRTTSSNIRYAKATVNGVSGVVLLPDNWNGAVFALNNTNEPEASFTSNEISVFDWTTILEANGAAFLPVAGYRHGSNVYSDSVGRYWSSTYASIYSAYALFIFDTDIMPNGTDYRCQGFSVRLVQDY